MSFYVESKGSYQDNREGDHGQVETCLAVVKTNVKKNEHKLFPKKKKGGGGEGGLWKKKGIGRTWSRRSRDLLISK